MSRAPIAHTPAEPLSAWSSFLSSSAKALRRANPLGALDRSSLRQNLAKAASSFEPQHFAFCLEALERESRAAGLPLKAPEALDAALSFAGPLGLQYAKALLAAGADPNQSGFTPPIHFAVGLRDPEFLAALIRAGADLNQRDAYGQTPLIRAAANGLLGAAETLIGAKAELDAVDSKGRCALHAALANAAAVPLISASPSGQTPLSESEAESNRDLLRRQQGMLQCARLLLDAKANPFAGDPGASPISIALELNQRDLAHRLLDLFPDPGAWRDSEAQRLTAFDHWSKSPYVKAPDGAQELLSELFDRAQALQEGQLIQSAIAPAAERSARARPAARL